jgi:hypothetical protein
MLQNENSKFLSVYAGTVSWERIIKNLTEMIKNVIETILNGG